MLASYCHINSLNIFDYACVLLHSCRLALITPFQKILPGSKALAYFATKRWPGFYSYQILIRKLGAHNEQLLCLKISQRLCAWELFENVVNGGKTNLMFIERYISCFLCRHKLISYRGRLAGPDTSPNQKVNKAEELTYLSTMTEPTLVEPVRLQA